MFSRNHLLGLAAHPLPDWMQRLCAKVERYTGNRYNSALVNRYQRLENLSLHKDNDPWLGDCFDVPGLSFGQTRTFAMEPLRSDLQAQLKAMAGNGSRFMKYELEHGDLMLLIGTEAQESWKHGIVGRGAKQGRFDVRYSITFRNVILDDNLVKAMPKPHPPLSIAAFETAIARNPAELQLRGRSQTSRCYVATKGPFKGQEYRFPNSLIAEAVGGV